MVSLDKAVNNFSYERAGVRFELYVDPDAAYAYIEKRKPDLKNILVAEEVYSDAHKGEKAKPSDIQKAFGAATDIMAILEFVLKNGEVQLTTEQRRKKVEERRKQVIAILLREAIDPRTNTPHTQMRIENALEEAKVHFDPFKDPREQLTDIVKELRRISSDEIREDKDRGQGACAVRKQMLRNAGLGAWQRGERLPGHPWVQTPGARVALRGGLRAILPAGSETAPAAPRRWGRLRR